MDKDSPPWLLLGDVAARIANEHRVSCETVQSIDKALHAQQEAGRLKKLCVRRRQPLRGDPDYIASIDG